MLGYDKSKIKRVVKVCCFHLKVPFSAAVLSQSSRPVGKGQMTKQTCKNLHPKLNHGEDLQVV